MTQLSTSNSSRKARLARYMQPAATLAALVAIPVTTGAMATVETATQAELGRFISVLEQVKAAYVEPVSDEQLIDGAIDGMLTSLDPHSGYLDESGMAQLRIQTEGEYSGLGLSVTMEDGAVRVIAPTAETPADRAGIKAGDYITHINGQLIVGYTLDEAVDQMRGEVGTSIRLTIARPGRDAPLQVELTRARIVLRPVTWQVQDNVGVLRLTTFSENAARELASAMSAVREQLGGNPQGWVLDLRSNPGGLLNQAVHVSDLFLEDGLIVSQRGRMRADEESYNARAGDAAGGLPVIVLIDAGSASASEIVAGALQDHHRAVVMGETSFGKGSVQTVIDLTDTTGLRLTTARYYTPSGRSIQEGGVRPDIRVPQLTDPDYRNRPTVREADLRRHLTNETAENRRSLEEDRVANDPRFAMTIEQLRAQGIEDFQLHYALQTMRRLASGERLAGVQSGPRAGAPAGRQRR